MPALTTTPGSNWKRKAKEIDELGLREISLFPTFLDINSRKILYQLIERTKLKAIPFVHLRHDFTDDEIDYLATRWGAKCFNMHADLHAYNFIKNSRYQAKIFVETHYAPARRKYFSEKYFKKYKIPGLCADFSHLAAEELEYPVYYPKKLELIKNYSIKCCHVSAFSRRKRLDKADRSYRFDSHEMRNVSDLNYLRKFPKKWFSNYIAIELENSFRDQLKAKKYIEKILSQIS